MKRFGKQFVVVVVAGIAINDLSVQSSFAGDQVVLTIIGPDPTGISLGSILCDPNDPVKVTNRIEARVVIFKVDIPITKGYPVINLLQFLMWVHF